MRLLLPLALLCLLPAASSAQERTGFALTVYSSARPGQLDSEQLANYGPALPGYALVRDQRVMTLDKGRSEVRFTDVAARMDPSTVAFASLTDPDGTRVIEQNYQFDLVSGDKLLQRYLGQAITVEQVRGDALEATTGELLSAQNGLTLRLPDGEIATFNTWSGIRFPSLPGGLIVEPSLLWLLDADRGGRHEVRVSYQARGMTWWADYNAVLDESKGCVLDLTAWVTLVNQSGASYPDTRLKLVAGEVNRAPQPVEQMMVSGTRAKRAEMAAQADGFQESGLFEYHLYTLGRRTDLPDNSTKQIELLPAASAIACSKKLVFTAAPVPVIWGQPNLEQGYAATSDGEVGAWLEFANSEKNGLGVALPAGRLRVNQLDRKDGSLEFIGEDVIDHTPRNETLKVKLGTAFDVVGERRQTAFNVDTKARWAEETFVIEVRNRKHEPVDLVVREYLYRWSEWRIRDASHEHAKRDAQTIDFPVRIEADGSAEITYTVRYSW